jgi:hypothetical protein
MNGTVAPQDSIVKRLESSSKGAREFRPYDLAEGASSSTPCVSYRPCD